MATGIFPPDIGGPATYAETLAGALIGRGFKVKVITYSSVRKHPNDNGYSFKLVRVWKKNFWFFRHAVYALKVFFSGKNSDAIYSLSTLNGGIPALISSKFFKKKFFVKIVGDYAWQVAVEKKKGGLLIDDFQKSNKKGWVAFLYWLQSFLCLKADKVIVPSEYLAGIVRGWGVSGDKIEIIYNGVDFKPSDLSKEEARRRLGIFGHIILSAGRLVPWKGFRMLIKIMPSIFKINQAFRLVIVGDGPDKKILESMIKNLGLEKKVFLVGRKSQEELAVYLTAADMFVLGTGYEGFSHQILEAMVAGVPVITTAVGGNREVIEQGENGFLVKYNDEFNLVEAVKSLWQDPDLKEEFIKNGKKTVEKFSLEKMISETVKVLTE